MDDVVDDGAKGRDVDITIRMTANGLQNASRKAESQKKTESNKEI